MKLGSTMFRYALTAVALAVCVVLWQRGSAGQVARGTGARLASPSRTAAQAPGGEAPAITRHPLRTAYFGELHVHTSWSLDAFSNGNVRDDPTTAYRYGRGDPLRDADGTVRAQLRVPL